MPGAPQLVAIGQFIVVLLTGFLNFRYTLLDASGEAILVCRELKLSVALRPGASESDITEYWIQED
jgi:hypothetical protein